MFFRALPCRAVCVMTISLSGCGANKEGSFEKFAKSKEVRLRELINKNTGHTWTECRNFSSRVKGDNGMINFFRWSSGPRGEIGSTWVGWRAKYVYQNGAWAYVSSERQDRDKDDGHMLSTWSSADKSKNSWDGSIVTVLMQLER